MDACPIAPMQVHTIYIYIIYTNIYILYIHTYIYIYINIIITYKGLRAQGQ